MSQPKIDLSMLPAAIRGRVEQALLKLPPEQRQQLLQNGSPQLNQLLARAQALSDRNSGATPPSLPRPATPHVAVERMPPRGHFNQTIQPGDRGGLGWAAAVLLVVLGGGAWLVMN